MTSFLVIGGGAVGASLTYRLAASGAEVTLLDAGQPGSGTTSATFAISIATRKTPRHHHDLAVAGMAGHEGLAAELGLTEDTSWVHPAPVYEWATNEHDHTLIGARVARLQEWDYAAEWIDGQTLHSAEPHLAVDPRTIDRVALYPDECWYDPDLMVRTLVAAARSHGAVIKTGSPVTALEISTTGVTARAGHDTYAADRAVVCAGHRAPGVARLAGFHLPITHVPGLVVRSGPVPDQTLRGMVLRPDVNLRPGPGGQLVAHSYTAESDLPDRVRDPASSPWAQRILEHASGLLPAFGRAGIASARLGLRPVPADGMPIVGRLEDSPVYAVVAHSGIHLAPVLSQLAARELLDDVPCEDLVPFRPDRSSLTTDLLMLDESTREMNRILADPSAASSRA